MTSMRVLYVEDEIYLAKIVKESLQSRGFEVYLVDDGNKVIRAFREFKPDICVFDVMLPNQDGFSLARQVKEINPGMPVLFLTAKSQPRDVIDGFESGGNDYLRKPFSMEELIVRMINLLELTRGNALEKQPSANQQIRIGAYRFYPIRQTLHYREEEQTLSHRESELLHYLFKNRDGVIDRRQLLLDLWGDDSVSNSRNLDVYISKLRNLLKADPGVEIRTLKGVGYRLLL